MRISQVEYCLGGNCIRRNFLDWNNPGGSYPGWGFSGWELSGGNHPGGNFPSGSFHVTVEKTTVNFLRCSQNPWKIPVNELLLLLHKYFKGFYTGFKSIFFLYRWSRSQMFFKTGVLEACDFIKKRPQRRCFHAEIAIFSRRPFFTEHLRWLLFLYQLSVISLVTS